jgi:hypothetical protein
MARKTSDRPCATCKAAWTPSFTPREVPVTHPQHTPTACTVQGLAVLVSCQHLPQALVADTKMGHAENDATCAGNLPSGR